MGSLGRFIKRTKQSLDLSVYKKKIAGTQFVSGPDFLVAEVLAKQMPPIAVLPQDLIPGFVLLGRCESEASNYGNITLVRSGSEETRSCFSLDGLELFVFTTKSQSSEVLWSDELEPEKVAYKVILACLYCPQVANEILEFALQYLHLTDDVEMKALPLFGMLNGPVPWIRLTLKELRRAKKVLLVDGVSEDTERGIICLRDSNVLRSVLRRYNVQFEAESPEIPEDYWQRRRGYRSSDFFSPSWGQASRKGNLIRIPIWNYGSLVVDTENLKLRTPVHEAEGLVEFDLRAGLKTRMTEETLHGDLKRHEIHTLTIQSGRQRITYRARFKDYYEGGPIQAELDVHQAKARRILFAFARAIENPSEMDRFRRMF